jgi:hypothetical protein
MTESMERSERVLVKYPLFKTAIARVQTCFDLDYAHGGPSERRPRLVDVIQN